jgi:membrane protease YdiL (CAAX protease family)
MRKHPVLAFLTLLALLSGGYVALMLRLGEQGAYLAQGYMLLPALAALITRAWFDERRFTDAQLGLGRLRDYGVFWLAGLGISALAFVGYTVVGAGAWDLSGATFLARLDAQFAAAGQEMAASLPPGFTPQTMLLLFFVGGLTVFNLVPGLITGFGEEFGWRGLLFPRLYAAGPAVAFVGGGLLWFAWHLPLTLVLPSQPARNPGAQLLSLVALALGAICTFTYLAYVYVRSGSVWVAAFAHIVLNNAQASLSYFFVLRDQTRANLALALTMALVVALLAATGRLGIFRERLAAPPPPVAAEARLGAPPVL